MSSKEFFASETVVRECTDERMIRLTVESMASNMVRAVLDAVHENGRDCSDGEIVVTIKWRDTEALRRYRESGEIR